jgi:hypothetical protein
VAEQHPGLCALKSKGQPLRVGEKKGVVVCERRRGGVSCTRVLQLTGAAGGAETEESAASGADSTEGLSNHRKEGDVTVGGESLGVVPVLQLLCVAGGGKRSGSCSREVRSSLGVNNSDVDSVVGAGAGVAASDVRACAWAQEAGVLHLYCKTRLSRYGSHLTLQGVVNVRRTATAGATEDVGGHSGVEGRSSAARTGGLRKELWKGQAKAEG